jgi:hypothetical protein
LSCILCALLDTLGKKHQLWGEFEEKMKVTQKVERSLRSIDEGTTFRYQNLGIEPSEYGTAAKAIERLIRKGVLKRASTGVFYKPKQSVFGELPPREEELLKPYLFENGKRIAYVTGATLYNRMGLTTQVPKLLKVACREKRITTRIGGLIVKPVKSYVDVTDNNYPLLEILDAIKDFKDISDVDQASALTILRNKVLGLPEKEYARLLKYALRYPPRTRALLGAMTETKESDTNLILLHKSLNPLTFYRIAPNFDLLPKASDWNIR